MANINAPQSVAPRLAILVAGTILPLIGFAAAIVYQHYRQDQRDAFARVLQNTRSIQLILDREMQGIVSGLTVLAGSDSFDARRFRKLPLARESLSGAVPRRSIDRDWRSPARFSIPAGRSANHCRRAPFAETAMRFSARVSRSFPNSSPDPCRTGRS
ncbi:MAG: hypothetical protein WA781_04200 [Pseudolabrys sp.]